MIRYTIEINDAEIESGIARSITLAQGDDLSKALYNAELEKLGIMAKRGMELLSQDEIKEQIETATNNKIAGVETIIEALKIK